MQDILAGIGQTLSDERLDEVVSEIKIGMLIGFMSRRGQRSASLPDTETVAPSGLEAAERNSSSERKQRIQRGSRYEYGAA